MPGPWLFCQVVRSLPGGPSSLPGPGPARVGTPRPCEQLASSAGLSAGELTPRAPAAPASVDPSLQDLAGTRGGVAGGTFLDSSRPIRPLLLTPLGCCEGGGICSAVRDPPGRQLKLAARQYPSCKPLRTPHGSVGTTPLQEDFLGAKGEVVGFSQRVGAVSTPRGAGPQGLRHSCCRSTMTRLPVSGRRRLRSLSLTPDVGDSIPQWSPAFLVTLTSAPGAVVAWWLWRGQSFDGAEDPMTEPWGVTGAGLRPPRVPSPCRHAFPLQ